MIDNVRIPQFSEKRASQLTLDQIRGPDRVKLYRHSMKEALTDQGLLPKSLRKERQAIRELAEQQAKDAREKCFKKLLKN